MYIIGLYYSIGVELVVKGLQLVLFLHKNELVYETNH